MDVAGGPRRFDFSALMTVAMRPYPTPVHESVSGGKVGQVALDQIRAVDKARLLVRLGAARREIV